jgi:hypothetical protein
MVDKIDLRKTEWREAIIKIADAVKSTALTNRALALLIVDATTGLSLGQVTKVLEAIPTLKARYLK